MKPVSISSWERSLADQARVKAWWGPPEEGIAAHLDALDLIERIRAPQVGGAIRAQAFSHWAGVYYRLAGLLLQRSASSATPHEDFGLAFRTIERFRARELLETLEAPTRFVQTKVDSAAFSEREEVLARISRVQRALSDFDLDPSDRQDALRELDDLEALESDLRDQLLRESPAFAAVHQPTIPDLAEVQALLAPDQALLSYQLWDGESSARLPLEIGQSWLTLVTRDQDSGSSPSPLGEICAGGWTFSTGLLSSRDASGDSAVKRRCGSTTICCRRLWRPSPRRSDGWSSSRTTPSSAVRSAGLRAAEDAAPIGSRLRDLGRSLGRRVGSSQERLPARASPTDDRPR